ncbi:hypothetical protein [Williamsia sp. CHRR-6]|uniref:hypothetical protein n=1 Tax=Williamsia sp. CHRR-6 TaxID=2835871 RepID=UPI001BD9A660|nr:hypothetical protein [Williamsia sp. CHRR-6]MBT0568616.1 hypothetical protein [Williamsia sp. CHRR-6]
MNTRNYPPVLVAPTRTALAAYLRMHPAATVISPDPAAVTADQRSWWPLLDMCADQSVAATAADHLTRDLPANLTLAVPDAATVLTGALHAAALVGWPPVTVAHILDAGAIPTIVELLGADGDDDLALCVAAAAGDLAPDRDVVRHAAALAGRELLAAAAAITGPTRGYDTGGNGVWREVRGAQSSTVIVHTDDTALGHVIADRLFLLASATESSGQTRRGSVA